MQLMKLTGLGSRLLRQQHAALGSAAAASSSLVLTGIAAYSQKVPGPTPVQGTGGGDRPSTNDETRDLGRYGDSMAESSGRAAIELETDEIRRAEAGEHIFDPHVAEEEEIPEWKRASMLQDSSRGSDPRASSPSDANRRWMSADNPGTRVQEATTDGATPTWPKPGPAQDLGTPERAGAPMDASISSEKPHATSSTSKFGGNPAREEELPAEEFKQGHAVPNEAAANQ